ncbi:DUF6172 family protein [Thiosulfativibrio zosterae]|uniref:Uncharacterized protein n=1 Tax=Thiosulfativibrio zosterae TaxID=2675053 RepID=A0A6F8PMT5_9GAMM|nr:DUF6172 family protein [Thiosulfativibrio zosterae]BBP43405.1 hypothetical protein THMIRHAT_11510 [Thiosulfativibrio zosterae]
MKKTFKLTHEKIHPDRLVESIKHEIRRYLKRERNKPLPTGVDFWDFDCAFGANAEDSESIHVAQIDASIMRAVDNHLKSFYLEILAKPGRRKAKPKSKQVELDDDFEPDYEDNLDIDFDHSDDDYR